MTHLKFNSSTHPIVRLVSDHNSIVDHGLRSSWSYLIYYDTSDSLYKAVDGVDKTLHATTSTDAGVVLNGVRSTLSTAGGGVIKLLDYPYQCATGFTGANNVSIVGEQMGSYNDFTKGTVLEYTGGAIDAFLDYHDCRWFTLQNMKVYNTGSAVSGLLCGGTNNDQSRTKAAHFSNLLFDSFDIGIEGYNTGTSYGPDDCTFVHVWVGNCNTVGMDNLGNNRLFNTFFFNCPIGLRMGRIHASVDAGLSFYGSGWSGCPVCIDINGSYSINHLGLYSCWLEDVDTMILNTQNATAGTNLGNVLFQNCIMATHSRTFMDLSGRTIVLEINGGSMYPTIDGALGTADAGGDATHTVDAALTQIDDYWNGYYIQYFTGANAGEAPKLISDFDAATDTATHAAFPNATAVGDYYLIGGAAIITDGAGSTYQRVRVMNSGGNLLYFDDSNSGLQGFNHKIIPFMNEGLTGYTPGAPLGVAYTAVCQDRSLPLRPYSAIKAYMQYRWNPGSASDKMNLAGGGTTFCETTPVGAGMREDIVDCSAAIRNTGLGDGSDLTVQALDDNANIATYYYAFLVVEY